MASSLDERYPCRIVIDSPFPTPRLASIALKALQVDKELSPLVHRSFSIAKTLDITEDGQTLPEGSILRTDYRATTNRMLRVAVNSFMESLSLVLEVMENLDEDVLAASQEASK
ncbi:transcription factor Pcc1-domain-containing protein [Microdochium trichocladiopsis]|uniref:Transcription factor Pcc1-domain-containing protein n=1 Tax=Microdochium trichocladiopsis TaxID=1682393 RepID=A0A9P8YC22_9PEZI|nr:transcription factor Pcc1-domain-containing protein [Microdochium trichocladiopsis]KAH7035185.1 transcription factor Pcc1-domain-containing protein [Microdochium trichocladiopsis]